MISAVRSCVFSEGSKEIAIITDATMGQKSQMHIMNLENLSQKPVSILLPGAKGTIVRWANLNKHLLVGHEDGKLSLWDSKSGECLRTLQLHSAQIQDLQLSKDGSWFISASKDQNAKVVDSENLKVLKTFATDRPVNSASISPIRPHIMLGGGQEAMSVTTTSLKQGKFEVRFFHTVFQDELGRVKGHFGPINTLAFHPDGRSFASGGEDGFVRLHFFDDDYFEFKYEEEDFEFF